VGTGLYPLVSNSELKFRILFCRISQGASDSVVNLTRERERSSRKVTSAVMDK
jgi:hypothetical protein